MNTIATMGKFDGVPTRKASAKYGGASTATWPTQQTHKFPIIRITNINCKQNDINIKVDIEDNNET